MWANKYINWKFWDANILEYENLDSWLHWHYLCCKILTNRLYILYILIFWTNYLIYPCYVYSRTVTIVYHRTIATINVPCPISSMISNRTMIGSEYKIVIEQFTIHTDLPDPLNNRLNTAIQMYIRNHQRPQTIRCTGTCASMIFLK